jgi:hypothetical protein
MLEMIRLKITAMAKEAEKDAMAREGAIDLGVDAMPALEHLGLHSLPWVVLL